MKLRPALWLIVAGSIFSVPAVLAQTTFSNATPITINDAGAASPYPSDITVSGLGSVSKVTLTLSDLSHSFPDDIDMLLVGPAGQRAIVFSDVGGGPDVTAAVYDITLDDAAPAPLLDTGPLVSGTFQPTNSGAGDPFPAPAPAGASGSALSVFNGTNPNGTWSLFVVDDTAQDEGNISGGWSLSITAAPIPEPSSWILLGLGMAGMTFLRRLRR